MSMLTVTPDAIDAIKAIASAGEGGLRISTVPYSREGSGSGLLLEPVEGPAAADAVIEAGGARVYVDEGAVAMLEGKVLDADDDGRSRAPAALAHVLALALEREPRPRVSRADQRARLVPVQREHERGRHHRHLLEQPVDVLLGRRDLAPGSRRTRRPTRPWPGAARARPAWRPARRR